MQQIVGRVSYMILLELSAWTWCPVRTDDHLVPDESDRTFDWSDDGADDRAFDWSMDEDDDDDDDDDDVQSAAAAVLQQLDDDVYAGKMMAFFAKLNSLRRKSREGRSRKPESSSSPLEGLSSLPPPSPTNSDRDRKSGFRPGGDDGDDDSETTADYYASPPRHHALHGGPALTATRPDDRHVSTVRRRRRAGHDDKDDRGRPAGRLHMGWDSARCVWRAWRRGADGDGRRAREWLADAARFWAAVLGVSVAALWAAFGSFHGPACAALLVAADARYARDVNRYLNTVPPHAVVTGRGKMFRCRPTAEERFLWRAAKKVAGFRV